jgi:uncharacterized membrane protein
MSDILSQIQDLSKQLQELRSRQLQMSNEMMAIERQLAKLKASISTAEQQPQLSQPVVPTTDIERHPEPYPHQLQEQLQEKKRRSYESTFHVTQELEDFIGTNLISKIGILVTIVGVFIGAKYAIDKDLISPLMRILLGYASSGVLVFLALRLKPKYENFSSILMGGGLAVAYFITYIGFSFYHLFPQAVAFTIMIVTTAAAVGVSLWYNQKVIALLGQVAAYAIPFLLGDRSGNAAILFAYISIINIGLMILSFKKEWKVLYHIAFFLTWTIYASWTLINHNATTHFNTGLIFCSINFITFYVTFLSYKIYRRQLYQTGEIGILLLNALVFFFIGAFLVSENYIANRALTIFTLCNAVVHFTAGYFIYRLKLADKTVFQFMLGLGLLFVTVAIPIELDGSWVTLLWTIEATTFIYIGYSNKRNAYLSIALPLIIIALLSLIQDWGKAYPYINQIGFYKIATPPFVNLNFWLSLFVCSCFGFISWMAARSDVSESSPNTLLFFKKLLPVLCLILLYFTLYNEIHLAWDIVIQRDNVIGINGNQRLLQLISLLIYSCLYIAAILAANLQWIKSNAINNIMFAAGAFVSVVMVVRGFYILGELRENYLRQELVSSASNWLIAVRYFCFMALAVLWITGWRALKSSETVDPFPVLFSILFNFTLLAVICNEFINWMDLAGYSNQYKLGLSIICGLYALALIFVGILRKKKHLRMGGMFLFGLTLLKLFFYDLVSLSTISKTIVLLMLGILLLIASFLYNKYKDLLFTKDEGATLKGEEGL